MDKYQFINSMIAQINNSVRLLIAGEPFAWFEAQRELIKMLTKLKDGLQKDDAENEETIKNLKADMDALKSRLSELYAARGDTALNGGNDNGDN